MEEVDSVIGANMAFRRDTLLRFGGFTEGLGAVRKWRKVDGVWVQKTGLVGEERELCIRLLADGGRISFVKDMQVKHKVYPYRLQFKNLMARGFWEGYSKGYLKKIHGDVLGMEGRYLFQLIKRPPGGFRALATTLCVTLAVGSGYLMFGVRGK